MKKILPCSHDSCLIRLDYSHMMADAVGEQGFSPRLLESWTGFAQEAHNRLRERRSGGKMPWLDLPALETDLDRIETFHHGLPRSIDTVVVLGIGAAAVGARALRSALAHPYLEALPAGRRKGHRRFFALDTADPETVLGLLEILDPRRTLFQVVSRCGDTPATVAPFLLVRDFLRERLGADWKKHVVITTDAEQGFLSQTARQQKLPSLPIPAGVPGRFAVLTAAALLPAALIGADIRELFDGARLMDSRLREPDLFRNPAYLSALFQYLCDTRQGRNIVMMMPFADRLAGIAEWSCQVWGESVGKRLGSHGQILCAGSTPLADAGLAAQHGHLQLLSEGPQDKLVVFLGLDRFAAAGDLPREKAPARPRAAAVAKKTEGKGGLAKAAAASVKGSHSLAPQGGERAGVRGSAEYLSGSSLELLFQTERIAMGHALRRARRPNMTLLLPEVTPCTIGQLLVLFEVQAAFAAELYQVPLLGEPGADEARQAVFAMMGCRGFEKVRKEIESEIPQMIGRCVC